MSLVNERIKVAESVRKKNRERKIEGNPRSFNATGKKKDDAIKKKERTFRTSTTLPF